VDIEVDAYIGRTFKGTVTQIARSATSATGTASLTSDQVTNFEVRITIDPASYQDLVTKGKTYPFLPGMSASVEINTETEKDVVSVPIQTVTTRDRDPNKKKPVANTEEGQAVAANNTEKEETRQEDLKEVVFIVSADTVSMVEVKTGIQDDTYIQILSGLKEGQEIVVGPYTAISRKLKQGDRIQRESDTKKKPAKTEETEN
jgi:HlyD family secretion protein